MATRRTAAKRLQNEHDKMGISWRELARTYAPIPAGTLDRIASSGGTYWPRKWAAYLKHYFGVGAGKQSTQPRRLADMSPAALRWALEHRTEF